VDPVDAPDADLIEPADVDAGAEDAEHVDGDAETSDDAVTDNAATENQDSPEDAVDLSVEETPTAESPSSDATSPDASIEQPFDETQGEPAEAEAEEPEEPDDADEPEAEPKEETPIFNLQSPVPDPYFFVNGDKHAFLPTGGDCTGVNAFNCTVSTTPIQDALDAVAGGLTPDNGIIYVEGGTYAEDLQIVGMADLTLQGAADGNDSRLAGTVDIQNASHVNLYDFIFEDVVSVTDSGDIGLSSTDDDDQIEVSLAGDVQGLNVDAGAGDDTITLNQGAADSAVSVQGGGGDDTLVVDFAAGGETPTGELEYDGGDDYDVLEFEGGDFEEAGHQAHDPSSGVMTFDAYTVTYANIEPITQSISTANVTLNFSTAAETITIRDGGLLPVTLASNTFDAGLEGWTARDDRYNIDYFPGHDYSGGNPWGMLQMSGIEECDLVAPAAYLGDLSAAAGGTFTFDARRFDSMSLNLSSPTFGRIYLDGPGGSAVSSQLSAPSAPVEGSWRQYSVAMTAANFGVSQTEFDSILSNVTSFRIGTNFFDLTFPHIVEELFGFDNFVLSTPSVNQTIVTSNQAESVAFANPTNSLVINAGDSGDDIIYVEGLGSGFAADLTINGQGGTDTVIFRNNTTDTGSGNLSVTAEEINVYQEVDTGGGNVSLTATGEFMLTGSVNTGGGNLTANANEIKIYGYPLKAGQHR